MNANRSSWLLFAVLLLALVPLRLRAPLGPGPYGVDASYYYQIARHVAEGDGLQTSVSAFHEGAAHLPTPTRIYPLWPVLLGAVGSIAGLHNAAQALLFAFYFFDLTLLFLLGDALARRMIGPGGEIVFQRGPFVVTVGHLAALVFATNRKFYEALGDPYTEGLAFFCAFASLLLLARERQTWWSDALSGLAAACAFLARSQMAAFAAGVGAVMLFRAFGGRENRRALYAWAAGAVLPVALWYVWLAAHFPVQALNPFYGISPFFKYSQVPIRPFVWWIPTNSFGEWLRDRVPGLVVAFDPRSPYSYFASFGASVALVPLALVALVVRALHQKRWPREGDRLVLATLAGGLAANVVLLHFHGWHFIPWLFGWRHGLPFILLITMSLAFLLKLGSRAARGLVAGVVLISVITGAIQCARDAVTFQRPVTGAEQAFVDWAASFEKPPTFLTTQAQILGMLTRANYHWTHCRETPEQTRAMLQHLPIDYVLVFRREERPCTFVRGLEDTLEPYIRFESPDDAIWVLKRRR